MKSIILLLLIIIICTYYFVTTKFQFGGQVTKEQQEEYKKTGHYTNGRFQNLEEFSLNLDCHSIVEMLKKTFRRPLNISPKQDISVVKFSKSKTDKNLTRVTWLGHSSLLIEIDYKNILIDPVFSNYAAPHPLLGQKRYNSKMPVSIGELPHIDFVLISHDHYDHLDYKTIKALKGKVSNFLVPLGVGNHLRTWGISNDHILELDWWEEIVLKKIKFIFTPSKHMSGRGFRDQKSTLWGSWIIKGLENKIYFSGDSGYGSHFKEIGEKYGPFDIVLMECGQYDKLWPNVHMMPEQTVQAAMDVNASLILPIHWGTFTLANHGWTEPIERILLEANKKNIPVTTPEIGDTVELGKKMYPTAQWWKNYN